MTPLEVCTALIGGMDATDRAKVAKMLGSSATPAKPQQTYCQRNGHKFKAMGRSGGGLFSAPHLLLVCEKCGRERKN